MDCPSRERAGWLLRQLLHRARGRATCAATRASRRTSSRTSCCREVSPTCPTACCPCATRPTTTTACSSPTGRCGSSSSWRSTWPAAATAQMVDALRPRVLQAARATSRSSRTRDGLLEKLHELGLRRVVRGQQLRAGRELPVATCSTPQALDAAGACTDCRELAEQGRSGSARRSASSRSTASSSSTTPCARTASSRSPATAPRSASTSPSSSTWPRPDHSRGAVGELLARVRPEPQASSKASRVSTRPTRSSATCCASSCSRALRRGPADPRRVDRLPALHGRAHRHALGAPECRVKH